MAERVIQHRKTHNADAIVVDGDGLGAGVVDQVRFRGLQVHASIPDDPELEADLTGLQYGFSAKQQIQLEKKEDMKARGLASPDLGDCLAMSFAVNFLAKQEPHYEPTLDELRHQHATRL